MNSITILGTLTDDPARRDTRRGVVSTFRLTCAGTPRLWIDVETWGHLAGRVAQHLRKGRTVRAVGSLVHDTWTDSAGQRRDRWLVRAERVAFVNSGSHGDDHAGRADATSFHDAGSVVDSIASNEATVASASGPSTVTVQ
jgi:single-strand DNA-binding protein